MSAITSTATTTTAAERMKTVSASSVSAASFPLPGSAVSGSAAASAVDAATAPVLSMLHDPSLADDEIILAGKVYNISKFPHPGGDIIFGFGGMDVTPHYYSIHPFHESARAARVLAPYYQRDAPLLPAHCASAYTYTSDFQRELYDTAKKMLMQLPNGPFATPEWWVFNIILITVWLLLIVRMISAPSVVVAIAYGVVAAMIGLNPHHASSHGSISSSPTINTLFSTVSDLFGDSKITWFQQHILSHHPYTNEYTCDSDTRSTEPLFRVNTYKGVQYQAYWLYQHFYSWFLFTLLAVSKLFPLDTLIHHRYSADFRVVKWIYDQRWYTRIMRVIFLSFDILLPLYLHGAWTFLPLLWLKMSVGSFMLSGLFIISHNFQGVEMKSANDMKGGNKDWAVSQIENSCTYGGALAGLLTGGLNFQIEHHLFPRVNPVHYRRLSPEVRRICAKHGVKYVYYPSLWANVQACYYHLKQMSVKDIMSTLRDKSH